MLVLITLASEKPLHSFKHYDRRIFYKAGVGVGEL